MRTHIGGAERLLPFAAPCGVECEGGHRSIHLVGTQRKVSRLQRAVAHQRTAGSRSAMRCQRHRAVERRLVAVEAERRATLALRHAHRILVGVPLLQGDTVLDVGVARLRQHIEGVGHRQHRVGHEEEALGERRRGDELQLAASTQTVVAQVDGLVIAALPAIGGIAVLRRLGDEAQRVVGLHGERIGDVGEDARAGQHTVEH